MSKPKRREEILSCALSLFNERGTRAVTTNHIAKELGISPGNLYYHYNNREAIIRALFERLAGEWAAVWEGAQEGVSLASVRHLFEENTRLSWEYRFFYRELVVLLERDEALKAAYKGVYEARKGEIDVFMQGMTDEGLLRAIAPEVMAELQEVSWLISDFWLSFVGSIKELKGPEDLRRGVWLMLAMYRPYMTDKAKAEFASWKEPS